MAERCEQQTALIVPIRSGFPIPTSSDQPTVRGLRLIAGGETDPRAVFAQAYFVAEVARAKRNLIEAEWLRAYRMDGSEASKAFGDARDSAFADMRRAVFGLAYLPAMDRRQLDMKRRAIGSVWLSAEGRAYDGLRAAIKADEVRLPPRKRRCRAG